MISFGAVIAVALVVYLVYVTRGAILVLGVIGLAWYAWDYGYGTGGAEFDKAYYCEVLGDDLSTSEWNNVMLWTEFDERFDKTTMEYLSVFRRTSCAYAKQLVNEKPGNYGKIDESHNELGYLYRYYFFRNGEIDGLYRDNDQFLWQRALLFRIDDDCTLNRETGVCVAVPSDQECRWSSYGDPELGYNGGVASCNYDTTGKANFHGIKSKNFIREHSW